MSGDHETLHRTTLIHLDPDSMFGITFGPALPVTPQQSRSPSTPTGEPREGPELREPEGPALL
eukprot:15474721-Alexandrium_andersonii.AAC.1